MVTSQLQQEFEAALKGCEIEINGPNPWDLQVHDDRLFQRIASQGSLGLGEAYMEKWWDCQQLDEFFYRVLRYKLDQLLGVSWTLVWEGLKERLFNMQSTRRALDVGRQHYDLDNHLFELMLDKRMAYSCGYWKNASNLDQAQEAKLELICKKIGLKPGMKVLDIGCGWGSFAKYAAEKYQAEVVGITISQKQVELARKICQGLPIEIHFRDYRQLTGEKVFDRVVSVGQMEHVGFKNYEAYMKIVHRVLKDDGLFLLHSIGSNQTYYGTGDPWIKKYIFPHGMLPSIKQLSETFESLFVMEDWHNFGAFYDPTLMAWFHNFDKNWDTLKSHYNETFYRMWKYYLLSCAGLFRARAAQLWQIVLSKQGVLGYYPSVR